MITCPVTFLRHSILSDRGQWAVERPCSPSDAAVGATPLLLFSRSPLLVKMKYGNSVYSNRISWISLYY